VSDRQKAEAAAWDEISARQAADVAALEAVSQQWGSIHDMLLRDLPIEGARVIDCGCGSGTFSRAMAKRRAHVIAFDVSLGSLRLAREAGSVEQTPGEPVQYLQSAFERLPFPDATFAAAVGMFVLHHIELPAGARELARVMAPGGQAAFIETWQRNPLLKLARRLRGHCGVAMYGTPDEKPLEPADLDHLRRAGFDVELEYPGLVLMSLLDNNVLKGRSARASKVLQGADELLGKIKAVKPWGYYCVIRLTRR
jgi:SAM-dependent methyltransferase